MVKSEPYDTIQPIRFQLSGRASKHQMIERSSCLSERNWYFTLYRWNANWILMVATVEGYLQVSYNFALSLRWNTREVRIWLCHSLDGQSLASDCTCPGSVPRLSVCNLWWENGTGTGLLPQLLGSAVQFVIPPMFHSINIFLTVHHSVLRR
jgi:hypothetical protein